MRPPRFWQHDGILPHLLLPAAWLYDLAGRLRRHVVRPVHCGVPVICVGNLTAGGSGKTPMALALIALLARRGVHAHALTRGFGGRLRGPLRVDPAVHGVAEVGDEALLLARSAPTWVSADRAAGAKAAVAAGAPLIVMDDGFQNPGLHKDLALLVIDGGVGLGNGRVHPAGPLREVPERAWARCDGAVQVGPDTAISVPLPAGMPAVAARMIPAREAAALRGRPVVGFAGIGRPAKFFETLLELGVDLVSAHAFPDHHAYSDDEVMTLVEEAAAAGAELVTTAKDAVRLPPEARAMVTVVEATLEFAQPAVLESWLDRLSAATEPAGTA